MKEEQSSDKKIAVITGGGSGLGYAIAEKLIKEGITTIITGRNEDKLLQAKNNLGDLCHYYVFDLNDLEGIPAMTDRLLKDHKKIDILVNNAGVHLKKPMVDVKTDEFQQVIHTNLTAVFVL